jgi:hypothetical protein
LLINILYFQFFYDLSFFSICLFDNEISGYA